MIKVKTGVEDIESDYAIIKDRKCKEKFTMPADELVYVKCIPHDAGTYLDRDWMVTLDVLSCNSYRYERE